MNKIAFYGLILLTVLSCKTAVVPIQKNQKSETSGIDDIGKVENIYFKSSGTEPFWSLTFSEDKIVFKTTKDSLVFAHVEPVLAMDANVKSYRIKTETAQLNIQISQGNCINVMSGHVSPYAVSLEFKESDTSKFEQLQGCGQYVTDYRLHDIWVLEELNARKISKVDFVKEFPMLEIYTRENKFSGFAGCNRMNGSLFFEKGVLRFTNLASTKLLCEPGNKEAEFITALQQSNKYQIKDNRLILSNSSGLNLVFKKID